jgi:hypothetical protein
MIVGDPSTFAIESGITCAYERLSFRALGYFVLHVAGQTYGVRGPEATMLACSLDAVEKRLAERGNHTAPFAAEADAGKIVDAYWRAIFNDEQELTYFGIPLMQFRDLFSASSRDCAWAPDGDEAFDDGTHVLQFDVGDRVRLIAFRFPGCGCPPDKLTDVWIPADDFYSILQRWHDGFVAEWAAAPKTPESA